MKKSLLLSTLVLLLVSNVTFASFPIDKENKTTKTEQIDDQQIEKATIQDADAVEMDAYTPAEDSSAEEAAPRMSDKEMWITLALWFFLGGFAAHRWYRGKPVGWNILFILTAGGCGIWAIVDLVNILTKKF